MPQALTLSSLINRRIAVMLFLGFSSGLPLALTAGTLQAWLTVAGVDIKTIGVFALTGLPYTVKFLWAPLMDRYALPLLGRRRGWMLLTQLGLLASIAAMAGLSPVENAALLGALALLVAFLSASQDIAFDAYRADILQPAERGFGAAVSVTGYRMAMLTSGALALVLSDQVGWRTTYVVMAMTMTLGIAATLVSPEPGHSGRIPLSLARAVRDPFVEFWSRSGAWSLFALIVLYKLGDAFSASLSSTFLLRGLGFSATDVGVVNKGMGLMALLAGAMAGGAMMVRWGLYRSLFLFGILQAVTNLGFFVLAVSDKHYLGMVVVIGLENLAGGMGTAAFVALLMALCDHRYTATQFALLSALASIGRVLAGPVAGYWVTELGWPLFFFISVIAAFPGLCLLWRLHATLIRLDETQ
ncbi:MAG: AmpG family muropeptide MFS transporter [Gammaproteobacteria bacterium]